MVSSLDLLHLARTAAERAAAYLRGVERPADPSGWTLKGSRDFVTDVDCRAEQLVGEIYVDQLNARGGLLGRKVEWVVKDDQSKPDLARTLYEQLITADKVDLLMGPYATGAILSAMGVAQRYNKVLVHHTLGVPALAKYDMQFPAWSLGSEPGVTVNTRRSDSFCQNATPRPDVRRGAVRKRSPSLGRQTHNVSPLPASMATTLRVAPAVA